jgi:hypothetical protein
MTPTAAQITQLVLDRKRQQSAALAVVAQQILAMQRRRKILARQLTIEMTAGAIIEAKATSDSAPRFSCRPAYNGGELRVGRYDLPVVVDLAGMSQNPQAIPATLRHDDAALAGHVDTVINSGRTLILSGIVSGGNDWARQFIDSYKASFPWHASIEVRPLERPELIPAGQVVAVNGQRFQGPIYVARKSELYGVSFVPHGADDQTVVTLAAKAKAVAA